MKSKVDITITATVRPKLLDTTLTSFYNNLFCEDPDRYRIIINVDPVGEVGSTQQDMVDVCHKYFKEVIYNFPEKPSFSKAVIWCWTQTEAQFIYHLEDDWALNRPVKMKTMIQILKENPNLACLRFSKYNVPEGNHIVLFESAYTLKKGYYLAADSSSQFGLNPCLIKSEYVKTAVKLMTENINPEKQFRANNGRMRPFVKMWQYGIYSEPGQPALVTDIGRNWRKIHNFKKPKNSAFLVWEKPS